MRVRVRVRGSGPVRYVVLLTVVDWLCLVRSVARNSKHVTCDVTSDDIQHKCQNSTLHQRTVDIDMYTVHRNYTTSLECRMGLNTVGNCGFSGVKMSRLSFNEHGVKVT